MLLCDRNVHAFGPLGVVEGVHAAMFNSTKEFEQKALYYTQPEHEAERSSIVAAARALALDRHMWNQRAVQFVSAIHTAVKAWRHNHRRANGTHLQTPSPMYH